MIPLPPAPPAESETAPAASSNPPGPRYKPGRVLFSDVAAGYLPARILDKTEVATGLAITVDKEILSLNHRRSPLGNHRRISSVRILAFAEHIEVPEPNRLEAVGAGKHIRIKLIDVLGHGIGREGLPMASSTFGRPG